MKRHLIYILLTFAALVTSCSKDDTPRPKPAPKVEQTILLYMPGRSLMGDYRKNINGICDAVATEQPDGTRIMVCWQPESQLKATLCEIVYNRKTRKAELQTVEEIAEFMHSEAADIGQMMRRAAEYAPAERYGLIVGSHGKAWVPAAAGDILNRSAVTPLSATQSDDLWTPLPHALPTRSFGDSGHEIDIEEFAGAIAALPHRYDYIIFDACFMANIETLHELRTAADYIISSPCEIMAAGFPYSRFMRHLFESGAELEKALAEVCREFHNFYENDYQEADTQQSGCISLCVTGRLDALTDVISRITASPSQAYDPDELQSYEGLYNHIFYDLGDWIHTAYAENGLLEEFHKALDYAFPPAARLNTAAFFSGYNNSMNPIEQGAYSGVTTSMPSKRYREYYSLTGWYLAVNPSL